MDAKQTLKNLHKRFPEMSLDDLFAILDCYSDYRLNCNYELNQKDYNSIPTTPPTNISFTNGICESTTTGNIK